MEKNAISKIYDSIRSINRAYEVYAQGYGLSLYELRVYYYLYENDFKPLIQKELSLALNLPKTSISSLINKQVRDGYMELKYSKRSGREKIISLTEEGIEFATNIIKPIYRYENSLTKKLDEDSLSLTLNTLKEIEMSLSKRMGSDKK